MSIIEMLRPLVAPSAVALLLAGCGAVPDGTDEAFSDDEATADEAADGTSYEADIADFEPDLSILATDSGEYATRSQAAYDGTVQVVYVNFDGPVITDCAGCSDATTDRSMVIGRAMKRQQVDFEPYKNAAGQRTILARLRQWFDPYHVTFTTTRPAQGPYTMVVISPTYWDHHGIAPLDCDNSNRSDIAFVFRVGRSRFYTDATKIAQAAAHELGHSFGLAHVVDRGQIMQWASSGRAFGKSRYDAGHPSGQCFTGNVQDAPVLLMTGIGLRPNLFPTP